MGMKGIEVKRMRRKAEEHAAGAGLVVPDYEMDAKSPAGGATVVPVVQASAPVMAMGYDQPQPQQMYQPQQT